MALSTKKEKLVVGGDTTGFLILGPPTLEFWIRKSLLDLGQDMRSMMSSSGLRLLAVVQFLSVYH